MTETIITKSGNVFSVTEEYSGKDDIADCVKRLISYYVNSMGDSSE